MFHCTQCGACCKNIGSNSLYQHLPQKNGVCENFDETSNLCKIYEIRPLICRIDDFYHTIPEPKIKINTYHEINKNYCNSFQTN